MGDTEVIEKLKGVPQLLAATKRSSRAAGINTALEVVNREELPEVVVKGVSRLAVQVVQNYTDGPLRSKLRELIYTLAKKHAAAIPALALSLQHQAQQHACAPHSSRALARVHISPMEVAAKVWCIAVSAKHPLSTKEATALTEALAVHFALTVAANDVIFTRRANKAVGFFLEDEALLKAVCQPWPFILEHTRPLLRQLTHQEFSDMVLPAAKKSLLRNPEVTLQAVAYLCSGLNLDLSKYVVDITKTLASPLHAKEDQVRDDTVEVCRQLAKQCSDVSAVEGFVKLLFDVFFGSDGKLTVATHKVSVLQGVEAVSEHSVTGSSAYILSMTVLEKMVKVLETESHEGTLVQALAALTAWSTKFTTDIPQKLLDFLPKGLMLKTSTTSVRAAYLRCMLGCVTPSNAFKAACIIPHLLTGIDKALGQSTQILMLVEVLTSSVLLLKLSAADISLEEKVAPVWNTALDLQKGYFTGEKFFTQSPEDGLLQLVMWCELLLSQHTGRLGNESHAIHQAIVWCLVCSHSKVRISAQVSTKKLVSSLGGAKLAADLLKTLSAMTVNFKIQKTEEQDAGGGSGGGELSPAGVAQALTTINSPSSHDKQQKEQLALLALPTAFHPSLVRENPNLWEQVCRSQGLKAEDVIASQKDKLVQQFTTDYSPSPINEEIFSGLCRLAGRVILPPVVDFVFSRLNNTKLVQVTDVDYAIYMTPEGTLYNQSVVEKAFEDHLNIKNVKKSNKVYSHKEQIMMLEERKKELEKKRKEGRLELTPKQKEVLKAQTEKENAIRNRVKDLLESVTSSVSLLEAAVVGNVEELSPHFTTLIPLLTWALSSTLIAPQMCNLYVSLRSAVFDSEDEVYAHTLARTTVRVCEPAMKLPEDWLGEPLDDAVLRTLKMIHTATVPKKSAQDDDEEKYYCAPGFVYCFPFLEWVLKKRLGGDDKFEAVASQALQVISEHMAMRGADDNDLFHPRFLPRKQLLSLVINVISESTGRTQQNACAVLQEVCRCGSGEIGCDTASPEEISVLLDTLQAPAQSVRDAALRGLSVVVKSLPKIETDIEGWLRVAHRLWVAKHDVAEEVAHLASELWTAANLEADGALSEGILGDVVHPVSAVRAAGAAALAALAEDNPDLVAPITLQLIEIFKEKTEMTPAVKDQYDRVVMEAIDLWEGRAGVALALKQLAPLLQADTVVTLANFFVPDALGDRNTEVRNKMLEAAMAVVNSHGKETVNSLLPVFEKFLNTAPNHASCDAVRQSVIILMGSLAKHLEHSDRKIKPIVVKLVEALHTPSQQVQEAVANCLHPLVPAIRDECPKLVSKLMTVLLESENYGERKGAAYGLASLVKGMGILALKQLDIMNQLTNAIQDKKNYRYREGALFALEQLCNMLGKLFEPYIVHILPHLLLCFGDTNQYVREATDDTAKAVMSKLSAHGVKLVLPSLLAALEEDSWRTKTGSVELLGNMAFCAPKQLSSCLPSIVPRLIEVLSDSHMKVQKAGGQALRLIGSVIRNPEIQAIVPVLLAALQDPTKNTSMCLQTLLETKFVHFIDAPSLALIMPVVQRAFQDRSTEVRKMAAQIIGNMYSLTDQKDLQPYLPGIIPGLKASLLDPVPKVRSVSSRALGAMVKGMGESSFDDLLPWLMQTLTSESSSVDRSGAAQGLAEVVGGLGPEKLHRLMPDIIATAERSDIAPHVKDGYIMMFIFLPTVFQDEFTPYIGQIIPPILKALADENEFVRETALKAGQRIVNTYAESAITLLLPELEAGLFHDNWRIRYSSVQLLGDLLFKVSGVSGKMTTDTAHEDDNFGTEHSQRAIIDILGEERRNRVLAGLYMGRSDVAVLVRQAALHVWKVVVTNTPKTLREILPTLFSLLLGHLASTSYDKRQVAARTLGDLVRKLGERVLPEIIPILEAGLGSPEADQRQGVCIGLSEIMASTSKDMVLCFADNLVPTVRRALCDPLSSVRQAAAQTFDSLHGTVGFRALEDILPPLLAELENEDETREYALDGLKQVMAIKSRVVLPYLVPQLTSPPVNTQALCILASVAGDTLTRHLSKILVALLGALSDTAGTPEYDEALSHCQGVVLAVTDEAGVTTIVDELLQHSKGSNLGVAQAAVALLLAFCSNTRADYSDYVPQLLRGLIHLFTHKDEEILKTSWLALNAVTKSLDAADQRSLVADVRQAVKFAASDLKGEDLMPGFCLPKGIQPILPIFREAVLNGEPELKEAASNGLTEVIRLTSSDALKPSVVHVTGPLIRILGDRFAWNVKVAVLDTLALLLAKTGVMLKPFLPQLQTTFVKAVHDPHRGVRLRAGEALAHLITIHTKPDPLFTELHNAVKVADDTSIRDTMIQALRCVVKPAGNKMSEGVRRGLVTTLGGLLTHDDDSTRLCAAGALGVLLPWLPTDELRSILTHHVLEDNSNADWTIRHGRSAALFSALKSAPTKVLEVATADQISSTLLSYLSSDRLALVENAMSGVSFFLINHSSNEVKQGMCRASQYAAESLATSKGSLLPTEVARPLIPMLVNGTKEKNQVVRSSAEMALIAVLHLKEGDQGTQFNTATTVWIQNLQKWGGRWYVYCNKFIVLEKNVFSKKVMLGALEGGGRDSLNEVINKSLRRATYIPVTPAEIDPTLLT
ncbi:eIF-2-alpha kinase activator GCN1-like 1 [Homarus americanus]|uniref:eIF-2-alpha kinase activator GCN1-like 1 n=1 Tax=Homarus americanus TaxID=6706 RepID=A0A8J5N115_HOMAM|nr:eIF-2-alpha kinase activator GCN1-like 1 [Homarus americanus]